VSVITTECSRRNITRFPALTGLRQLYGSSRNQQLETNRRKNGSVWDIESWFYLRARAIADGKHDPMPTISELMPKSV